MNPPKPHHPDWQDWHKALQHQWNEARKSHSDPPVQDDVHRFRAALKYARAPLRLAPPSVSREANALRRTLGQIAQQLGPIRDHHVLAITFYALAKQSAAVAASPLTSEEDACLTSAQAQLADVQGKLAPLRRPSDDPVELHHAMRRSRRTMRRRRPKDWKTASAASIHTFRSAVIVCACQAHFLRGIIGQPKKSRLEWLNTLRSHLGDFNDLDRLMTYSRRNNGPPELTVTAKVMARAVKRQAALRRNLQRLT